MRALSHSVVVLFYLPLIFSTTTAAQQSAALIQRDPTALSIVTQAVAAGGGNSASLQSTGIVAKGNLKVAPAGISGPILWETTGTEFRHERPGANGTIVFVSGHGNPAIVDGANVQRNILHLAMNNLPPHLPIAALAAGLSNPNIQVSAPEQTALNATMALKISFVNMTDDVSARICKQDWYLDAKTLLPLRVDFLTSDVHNALSTVKMTYLFSNYQVLSEIAFPLTVDTLIDGQQVSEITFSSIQIGVSIPVSDFDVPASTVGGAL